MGLFDFVGNIGKKLFGPKETKEDAAAKIKAELVALKSRAPGAVAGVPADDAAPATPAAGPVLAAVSAVGFALLSALLAKFWSPPAQAPDGVRVMPQPGEV